MEDKKRRQNDWEDDGLEMDHLWIGSKAWEEHKKRLRENPDPELEKQIDKMIQRIGELLEEEKVIKERSKLEKSNTDTK